MVQGILGQKVGMAQLYNEQGSVVPVTYLYCPPNEVMQVKTTETDDTVGLVLGVSARKNPTKTKKYRFVKQITGAEGVERGSMIDLSQFTAGDIVNLTGTSKGKGFQGQVRRHNFRVARRTHGTKDPRHGSTNNTSITARQQKGLKMAGRMGNDQVTLRKCEIVAVDTERHLIAIKGPVPGARSSFVVIRKES